MDASLLRFVIFTHNLLYDNVILLMSPVFSDLKRMYHCECAKNRLIINLALVNLPK